MEDRGFVIAYVTRGRELLTVRQLDRLDGGLHLPGGAVEENETPEQAALREVFEETGLRVNKAVMCMSCPAPEPLMARPWFFFWLEAPHTAPGQWTHIGTGSWGDHGSTFDCRFEPLETVRLSPTLASALPELGKLMETH